MLWKIAVVQKYQRHRGHRAHQLQRKQEALELALKPLVAERDRVASQRARVVSVTINLATEREAELRLSYQVRGPGWQPSYRATLDANKSTVLIERQALVALLRSLSAPLAEVAPPPAYDYGLLDGARR